jgi:hypothetical protein
MEPENRWKDAVYSMKAAYYVKRFCPLTVRLLN